MSNLLTPAEVEAIRQRAEAITHGWGTQDTEQDYAFNAEVRSDIPRLLADREVLVKLLARAHGYLIQLVDDNDIFIDPEDVERVNEFCKEIEDAGVLAQVEGQET